MIGSILTLFSTIRSKTGKQFKFIFFTTGLFYLQLHRSSAAKDSIICAKPQKIDTAFVPQYTLEPLPSEYCLFSGFSILILRPRWANERALKGIEKREGGVKTSAKECGKSASADKGSLTRGRQATFGSNEPENSNMYVCM
jgi:hypothetical protein